MEQPVIERIDVTVVRVPRHGHNRVTHAYGTTPDAHYALVEVHAGGLTGLGEAPTERWWTGEDADTVRVAIANHLSPALCGSAIGIREAVRRMDATLFGHPYAKAAIQMALWDLLGKRAGLPLYALWGGTGPESTPIKYGIGWGDAGHTREEIARGRELGFGFFKLKLGRGLEHDLELTAAAVDALADGESIGVDVNGGWSLATAVRAVPRLAEMGIAFLEQPIARALPESLAEVARRSTVPVMVHEGLGPLHDAPAVAAAGVGHLWALTPSIHGGPLQTFDMLAIARSYGIPCLFGSTFELGIATAMLTHLGAAFPEIRECPVPSDVIGPLYVERDIVQEPLRVDNARIAVPDGPGLGIELDRDFVAACAV